ncbi:MAG: hypothetical protein KDI63_06800 [Gammaproteobacteria bacterium]|nr:hypothetical protein [Gammaproteobacteria bacterium]
MTEEPKNGTRRVLNGKECIYFDGYWIRFYPIPDDTLATRKLLIDHLSKRTFHHTEGGINTPGERLEDARQAYQTEQDPMRKRVNAAMLAGALFNRATDIFTAVVELESKGIKINRDNELMKQCADCFKEALELGRNVKHYSGEEGIDELWGEPFKAFTQPITQIFESRYRKIALTMRDIDNIEQNIVRVFEDDRLFQPVLAPFARLVESAKLQLETMKSDIVFFKVWPQFVANREVVEEFLPESSGYGYKQQPRVAEGLKLINTGTELITYLSEVRVPMPRSTKLFLAKCEAYKRERQKSTYSPEQLSASATSGSS